MYGSKTFVEMNRIPLGLGFRVALFENSPLYFFASFSPFFPFCSHRGDMFFINSEEREREGESGIGREVMSTALPWGFSEIPELTRGEKGSERRFGELLPKSERGRLLKVGGGEGGGWLG